MEKLSLLNKQYIYIYISGKITGFSGYENIFYDCWSYLHKDHGYKKENIINPVFIIENAIKNKKGFIFSWKNCMDECLKVLDILPKDNTIFLRLQNWKDNSKGCKIENDIAIKKGFLICDWIDNDIYIAEDDICLK